MPAIYILQSESTGEFYIGSCVDFPERLRHHQSGHTPSTRGRGPWKLAYREDFDTLSAARQRERQIKSWKSHRSTEDGCVKGRRSSTSAYHFFVFSMTQGKVTRVNGYGISTATLFAKLKP